MSHSTSPYTSQHHSTPVDMSHSTSYHTSWWVNITSRWLTWVIQHLVDISQHHITPVDISHSTYMHHITLVNTSHSTSYYTSWYKLTSLDEKTHSTSYHTSWYESISYHTQHIAYESTAQIIRPNWYKRLLLTVYNPSWHLLQIPTIVHSVVSCFRFGGWLIDQWTFTWSKP